MAYNFNNNSANYLTFGGAPVTAMPLTICCWIRPDQVTALDTIFHLGDNADSDDRGWRMNMSGATAGDPLTANQENDSGTTQTSTTTTGVTVNQWHHACGVYASTTSRTAYIDGGSSAANTTSNTAPTNINTFVIGRRIQAANVSPFGGDIAEVAIWNVALDAAEVAALGRGVSPSLVRPASLVGYWPLIADTNPRKGGTALTIAGSLSVVPHPRIIRPRGVLIVPTAAVAAGVELSLTQTLQAATLSSDVDVSGYLLSKTLDAVTLSSDLDILVQTNLTKTLGTVTLSSDLDVLAQVNLTKTLDAVTLSSDVAIGGAIELDLSVTLDAVTSSSTLGIGVGLSLAKTLDAVSLSSSLNVLVQLNSSQTLGDVTLFSEVDISDGTLGLDLAQTLAAVTSSSSLSVQVGLSLGVTLDSVTLVSDLDIAVALSLSKTLDVVTSASAVQIQVGLALSKTLEPVTLSSDLSIISGLVLNLDKTLEATTLSSTLLIDVQLNLTSTLGGVSLSSELLTGTPVSAQGGGYLLSARKGKRRENENLEADDLEVLGLILGMDKLAEFLE